jgi:hypothetical protein
MIIGNIARYANGSKSGRLKASNRAMRVKTAVSAAAGAARHTKRPFQWQGM